MDDLDQFVDAYEDTFPYARDNHGVLSAYSRELIRVCNGKRVALDICSLGIGYDIVTQAICGYIGCNGGSYTVIEGSSILVDRFRENMSCPISLEVIHGYFEDFQPDNQFDVIEMGFVLEHVDDPAVIVNRFSKFLKPKGTICAAVPNALSMHRVLGVRSGLLNDEYQLNQWDIKLGHKRYFDRNSFRELFERLGLAVVREAGLMIKPLATVQLNSLNLPEEVWEALFNSGDLAPSYAYGLYAEVCAL